MNWQAWLRKVQKKAGLVLNKITLKTAALALLGAALLLGVLFFFLRNALLRSMVDGKISSYQAGHRGAVVQVGSARFAGLDRLDFENMRMRSASGDFTVALGHCSIRVSFWKMLLGKVRLRSLELGDLRIDLRRGGAPGPVPARAGGGRAQASPGGSANPPPAYGERLAELLAFYFNRIPDSLAIDRLTIHSDIDGIQQDIHVPRLAIQGPAFATGIEVHNEGRTWSCLFAGEIDRGKKLLALRLLPLRRGEAQALPFIDRQWGVRVSFDLIDIRLKSHGWRNGTLSLGGALAVNGLILNHPRIASEDVNVKNAALDYTLRVGADTIELAEPSSVTFNRLTFHPRVTVRTRPTGQLSLKLAETRFAADDLFASLPAGLFTSLAGMRTRGELAFHLDFSIDLARPEELELDVDLKKSNFRIQRFGRADFREINEPFLYSAFEKDRAQRSFPVGAENPDFRALERIPSCLKNSVMISEDGAFFNHQGFLLEPFKNSIAANLKAGRFVRGASTITMQLAKNLYLRRHKTIARKLEEMLITWLIEENRLVAKERLLEIYLNIIEWGPGIYGAQQAARYYFAKDVEALTLAEAIFMASIIPRPKRFMISFDENQRLRPWLQSYYANVSLKMLKREWISQPEYDALVADVQLLGPARLLLKGNENPPAEETLPPIEEVEE